MTTRMVAITVEIRVDPQDPKRCDANVHTRCSGLVCYPDKCRYFDMVRLEEGGHLFPLRCAKCRENELPEISKEERRRDKAVARYIRKMEQAHKTAGKSKLVFKKGAKP